MGWGDELMVTGHARELQGRDPRRVRVVYQRGRFHESWRNNPRIAKLDERGDFQDYLARDAEGLRPYMTGKTQDRYAWRAHRPPRGEMYFDEKEKRFAAAFRQRIVIEPRLKPGASPNKDWGWKRWIELARLMRSRGLAPTLLGSSSQRQIEGVEFVHTQTMREAAAVLSVARAAVLPEGGLHHVAAAVGCPAVVIYGGFISPEVTGYEGQASLFAASPEHPLGCGWRIACKHCAAAMAQFTPQTVLEKLEALL